MGADTGIGLTAEQQAKLFQDFTQAQFSDREDGIDNLKSSIQVL